MRFPMKRFYQDERQTLGTLQVGKRLLFTIERPWIHNQPFHSCFPAGSFLMKMITIDDVVKVRLHDLGSAERPNAAERTLLNIEVSNWAHQLQGCVGVGMGIKHDDSLSAVDEDRHTYMLTNSKDAMGVLLDEMARWPDIPMYLDVDNP